jgi:LysM repeat protein
MMRRTLSTRGLCAMRRIRVGLVVAVMGVCALPAHASAHTVTSGESLSSVAAANGLTTDQLAAANGLSPDALLIDGESLVVPYPSGPSAGSSSGSGGGGGGGGGYVVQPGDTLSGIAAAQGLSTDGLAAANGLGPDGILVAGTTLTIPGSSGGGGGGRSTTAAASTGDAPIPTNETVSPGQVGDIAASENVSPSLADAVATQESGFDNSLVSSADARGVMQILPSTWDFINGSLASTPLDPASARDNVRAGALYLGYLADNTGNDPVSTVASYYQGLGSVQSGGLLPETHQYVDSVLALRDRYRGG